MQTDNARSMSLVMYDTVRKVIINACACLYLDVYLHTQAVKLTSVMLCSLNYPPPYPPKKIINKLKRNQ